MSTTLTANAAAPLAALQPLVFGDVAMCSSAAREVRTAGRLMRLHQRGIGLMHAQLPQWVFHQKCRQRGRRGISGCLMYCIFNTHFFSSALALLLYVYCAFIARICSGVNSPQENIGIAAELFQLGDERGVDQALCADAPLFALEVNYHLLLAGEHGEDQLDARKARIVLAGQLDPELESAFVLGGSGLSLPRSGIGRMLSAISCGSFSSRMDMRPRVR